MTEQTGGIVLLERDRIEALMRMLVESGDMTPMAVRRFQGVMAEGRQP